MSTQQRKAEIAGLLALLVAAYPAEQIPQATIKAYIMGLQDLDLALLKTAVLGLITSPPGAGQYRDRFPTIAQIRAEARAILMRAAGHPSAPEAWGQVTQQIRAVGHVRPPTFSHPLVAQAVEAVGGWRMLCLSENIPADRARFIQAYDTLIQRQAGDLLTLPEIATYRQQLAAGQAQQALPPGLAEPPEDGAQAVARALAGLASKLTKGA